MRVSIIESRKTFSGSINLDFVGAALKRMNVTADSLGQWDFTAPWQIDKVGDGLPAAYYLLRGQAEIILTSHEVHHIQAGDLIFVPRGDKHALRDGLSIRRGIAPAKRKRNGTAPESRVLHVTFQATLGEDCPFVSAMPPVLILKAGQRTDWPHMESHLQGLAWEANSGGPASALVLARLWEVLFLLAFRNYFAKCAEHSTGWLSAIQDPQLVQALAAIQKQPHAYWTVDVLADKASMSRATFIRQFSRVMGQPPMKFVYLHRMDIAA